MDSKTSREVLDFLKELNEEGNTIVIITHDSSIALEAKRVVRVHDGKTSRFVSADQMYGFYEEQGRNIQYSDIQAEGVRGGVLCSGRALRQPGEGH